MFEVQNDPFYRGLLRAQMWCSEGGSYELNGGNGVTITDQKELIKRDNGGVMGTLSAAVILPKLPALYAGGPISWFVARSGFLNNDFARHLILAGTADINGIQLNANTTLGGGATVISNDAAGAADGNWHLYFTSGPMIITPAPDEEVRYVAGLAGGVEGTVLTEGHNYRVLVAIELHYSTTRGLSKYF